MLNDYKICVLGRTGNGKTSLINAMFGTKFETNTLVASTKQLYTVTVLDEHPAGYEATTVADTPGIGEFSSDSNYWKYYEHAVSTADCIVVVTTFDRTDAPMQRLLAKLKPFVKEPNVKMVVALNHIDSRIIAGADNTYTPWDEASNTPSEKCQANIEARKQIIHERLDGRFLPFEVVPVCAIRNYGIEELKTKVLK